MSVPQGSQTARNSSHRHRAYTFGSSVSKMLKLAVVLLVLAAVPLTFAKHITTDTPFDMSGIYVYDVSPQSGPTSGGSKVTLTVKGGALPENEQYYFCKFGEQTVVADHLDIDGGSATVVCLTPETDTSKVVDVTFSVDGITYTKPARKQFSFHKPLVMQTISPSVGSIGGGTSVLVSLLGDVVSRKTETSTLRPTCNFDGMTSRGTLVSNPEGSSISCTVPSIFTLGHTDLSVSLNGVDYSENVGNFTIVLTEEYNSVVQKVTTHAMAGDPVFHVNGTSATGEFYGFFDMKFYDFYGFYGPSKDIAYDKQSEVCMVAVSPSVGRNAGGTVVTIKLAGVIPEGQETFFCKFGDKVVVADSFYYTEDVSPAIVCTAPEFGSGAGTVELKISFDGITYTNSGSAFYYHDDVKLDNILPSSGTHIGGTTVGVRLSKSPMPSSFEVGLTSVPALCKFDTTEVSGQYVVTNDGPAVVCKTPASDMGIVNVKVALDGQYFSSDSVAFTFSLDPDEVNPDHRMAVSRYLVEAEPESEMSAFKNESFYFYNDMGAMASQAEKELSFYEFYAFYDMGPVPFEGVAYKNREIKKVFDYLPFSPDYCLFFNAGPDTSLEMLEISNGTLFPAFSPSTYVYVTSVVKEVDCLEVATFPTDKNVRSVTVAGHKVATDGVSKCVPLTTGENLLDIVVTGQDGQTARTYSIVAVRLQGTSSSLQNVTIASTATNPNTVIPFAFDSDTLSYIVPVSVATVEIAFTPIPFDEDALVTTVVGGSMTYFGSNEVVVTLNAGDNIFEVTVEAEDGVKKTVYTVNVRRDSTDLLDLKMSTDEAQTNLLTLSTSFVSSTGVYTVAAGATDNKFYAKFDVTGGATVDVAYDIGAAAWNCPAGSLKQEGTFKDLDVSAVHGFCNPSGSNSMTITVKFGGASTTYTVAVTRSSAAASLSTLVGSAGNFVPAYSPDVYKYELGLKYSTQAFTLTPSVGTGAQSTVTLAYGSNSFSLSSGSVSSTISSTGVCGEMDKISITVTAQDGFTTATYEILPVKLAEGIHSQLSAIAFVNATAGSYVPAFQPSVTNYDFTVIRSHKTGTDTAVGTDPASITFTWNAPVTYSSYGNFVGSTKEVKLTKGGVTTTIFTSTDTTYSSTQTFAAISGQPEDVQLEVTACDGRTKTTYDFDVMRGQASNAFMCNLAPSAGTFDTAFSKTDYLYKLDVAGDATSIGFTPTVCDSFAKIEVGACSSQTKTAWTSGALYTKTLSTDFSVEQISTAEFCVTSEDGQTAKTYSVAITRPLSSEAILNALNIKLVKWDGSETVSSYTKATNTDPEIPATIAVAATYEQAYIQVSASATISTAAITLSVGGGTALTLTQGTYGTVLPTATSCVAPSVYYCDDATALCPELTFGANTATITVTSQDGQSTKTYTATVTRASITYEATLDDMFLIGHPILGLPELATASGLTTNALTNSFASVNVDTAATSKYGSLVAGEHILTALAGKSSLPAAPANADARFRAVTSPHVQFLNDIADKMITDQTLVDRVSTGYTFGVVSSATLGETETDSSPRVYVEPLFKNPYQKVKVQGVMIEAGCGRSLEADFGENMYKVETFNGQLTELTQYNVTVTRPYLSSGLLSGYVSTTALDQTFANTTFVYSTKVADTADEVTMSFTKYDSTSTVRAQLYYDDVLQSTVTATSAEKFALSPFGITKIVALVQTADGTDGGAYSFTFNKFPTVLKSLSTETSGGVDLALAPAFVDPSTVATEVVQTSYALSEITETNIFLKAATLDASATMAVKVGTTAVTAVAGKYSIPVDADTVIITITVTASNGIDTRVYTLTISKEQKNAAAAQSFVALATTTVTPTPNDPLTTFGAGSAKIPITGKTSAGKDALTGDFVCKVTGDATTFDQTFTSTFKAAGSFEVALPTVTIAGTYAYTCSLGGVALAHQLHAGTTGQLTIVGGTLGDKSILSLVSAAAVRGSPVEFKIRTNDDYGNEVNTVVPATDFTVTVSQTTGGTVMPATFNSTQTAGGVINWYFTPSLTYSGTYKVFVTVQVGGLATEIIGSDILLSTVIPVTAASGWEVAYSTLYQAGQAQNVVVKPKASTVASKDQEILVGITGSTRSGAVNTVYSCDSRTTVQCTVPLGLTITGNYTLNVTIAGSLVGDSLHSIQLVGGAVDLTKAQVVIPATAAAGTAFDVSLKLFDTYSNPASMTDTVATAISASFTKGALSATPTSVTPACYFYNCEFLITSTLTAEGTWKAVVKYQGTDIGVAKDLVVSAGAALASKTSVTTLQKQMVAGVGVALTAVPKDAYGNIIKVTSLPAQDQKFEAVILSDELSKTTTFTTTGDAFTGTLVINKAGTYSVIFKLGDAVAFTYALTVSAGAPDSTKTLTTAVTGTAGIQTSFTVQFRDTHLNPVSVDAEVSFLGTKIQQSTAGAIVLGEVPFVPSTEASTVQYAQPNADGTFGTVLFAFTPIKSGKYYLTLAVDGAVFTDAASVDVNPGFPSFRYSTVSTTNIIGAVAGQTETAQVAVKDSYQNADLTGLVSVTAYAVLTTDIAQKTLTTTVAWNAATGVYDVSYTSTETGSLKLDVSVNGMFLSKVLTTSVSSGPIDATNSVVTGDTVVVAGGTTPGKVTLVANDAFGNRITTGGASIVINRVDGGVSTPLFVTDVGDGSYTATFTFAVVGTGSVEAYIFDMASATNTLIGSIAVTVKDKSGDFSLADSTITTVKTTTSAGTTGTVTLTTKDDQRAILGVGGLHWSATAQDDTGAAVAMTYSYVDAEDGTYAFSYAITKAGTYTITVANTATFDTTFDNTMILGQFDGTVTAGAADGLKTVYTGIDNQIYAAGVSKTFTFDLYDSFDNKLSAAQTEQAITTVKAFYTQMGVKTPMDVSYVTNGAIASGATTLASTTGDVSVEVGVGDGVAKKIASVKVNAAQTSTIYTTDTTPVKTAGGSYTYAVYLQDTYLNPVLPEGTITQCIVKATYTDDLGASVETPLECAIGPLYLGVSFNLTKATTYTIDYSFTQLGYGESTFTNAQYGYNMVIAPGSPSSVTSVLEQVDVKMITAGEENFYSMTLKDAYGNSVVNAQASVDAFIDIGAVKNTKLTVTEPVNGEYNIHFGGSDSTIKEPTAVKINVVLNGNSISGSPYTIPLENILPAKTSVTGTVVRYGPKVISACTSAVESACATEIQVTAGTTETIELYAYNTLGIPQVYKQELVAASARVVAKAGQTVDADDTGLTAEPTVVYQTGNGIYNISFSANIYENAGAEVLYAIDIQMKAGDAAFTTISTSPVYFSVKPTNALPAASKIVATFSKVSNFASLSKRYLMAHNQINTLDKYGNQALYDPANPILITATAIGPTSAAVFIEPVMVDGAISGQYLLGVGTSVSGTYFITIKINGLSLESYSVTIEPGALDFTTVSLTSSNSVAGAATTGKLTGLDGFGNQLANDKLLTALTGATVAYKFKLLTKTGTSLGNDQASTFMVGTVTTPTVVDFSYTPKTEGTLEITADVTSATAQKVSAFKKYTVAPGAVDVPSSTVTGPALAGFLENTPSYFSVALKDAYGNVRTDLCPDLTVTIQEATTLAFITTFVTNATTEACDVGFQLPTGTYNIGVSYLSQAISSFSSSAVAVVGEPDLASTLVAGLGYGDVTIEAGEPNTFSVSLVAANGLLVPESQGETYVDVTLVDSLGAAVPSDLIDVEDQDNGQYDVEYFVQGVGTYTLSLFVGGALYSTTKSIVVLPTESFAQNVTATVPALVPAGDFSVDVDIKDMYGNSQTYDLYDVDAMQINVKETFETYIVEVSDELTGAEITIEEAGIYTLEFYFGTTLVSTSKVEVVAGEVDVGMSIVYGEGLSGAQAGLPGSFFIELVDEFDNLVTNLTTATDFVNDVTATFIKVGNASDVTPISLQVSLVQQAVKASYTLFGTGDYYLSLVHTDEETIPATVTTYTSFEGYVSTTVTAGLASAETITASQIPASPFAGMVDFQILVEDAYGNVITTNQFLNLFIVARGTGANLGSVSIAATEDITWVGDKYTVSMYIPTSGAYNLEITRGADTIKGSPYALTVASAPIHASHALVQGTGIGNFTAGAAVSVTVEPRDLYNNSVPISTNEDFFLTYKYADGSEVKSTAAAQAGTDTLIFTGYSVTGAEEGLIAEVSYFDGLETTIIATYTITVQSETTVSPTETIVSFSGTNVAGGTDVAVAGSSVSILVYPADQYGNAIAFTSGAGFESFMQLTGAQEQPEPTTLDAGFVVTAGGALSYTFAQTVAGVYAGDVRYLGVSLVGTEGLSLTIDTSDVVLAKTTVTGPTTAVAAGTPTTIVVKFFDKYDNAIGASKPFMDASPLTLPVQGKAGTESVNALVMSRSFNVVAKEYRVTVSSDKSGVMELKYIIDGVQLYETGSTPYTYTVAPGAFSTAETTVFGLDSLTAGQSEVFYIEPRDSLANALNAETTGALTVTTITSITPTVTFNALTGLYEVRFTTGDAASLGLTGGTTTSTLAFEVLYDGTVFKTLSTTTFLAAGTVSAANSLMVSDTTGVAVATLPNFEKGFSTGAPVTFKISFKDTNNVAKALTTAELSNVKLTIVPSAVSTTSLTPEGDVKVSFTAQTATDYSVSASYNGESLQGGAYAGFRVSAGLASGAKSFVSADTATKLDATTTAAAQAVGAGITSSLYVVAKDQYDNLQDGSSARANIVATMTSGAGATADVTGALVQVKDLSLSQSVFHVYEIQYTANLVGAYTLDISLGGVALANLGLTVSAGEFAPAKTVLATVDPVIGQITQLKLTAYDSYTNEKASEDITFDMTFVKGALSLSSVASYSPSLAPSTHSGTVTFVESGSYTLTVTSGGVPVMTKDVVVKAGPVSQTASTVSGLDGSVAGVKTTVTIIPRDASGNLNLITPTVSFSPAGAYAETVAATTAAVTIAFTPPVFGDVTITADFEGSPVVAIVTVTPSAPPAVQAAKMASLTSILMTFDMATNMGNMGASMDCNLVLATATVAKLGTGAACKFTTASTLGVTLGSEASILPVGSVAPDEILVKENAIANAAGNSYNATGSSLLQAPDALVQPVVSVMAPTTVGICEDLLVDASASSGSGGRNLAFSFQVEGLGDKILALSSSLKALADTKSTAAVDKNEMNFGINYNFIVSATNFLGQTTTAKIPVYRSDLQVPTVYIAGKHHVKTEASSQIAFPCRAIMPGDFIFDSSLQSCVKNSGGDLFPVDFSWKGDKTKATFDASALPASYAATLGTRDLTLPSNYLQAGKTYGFECTGADAAAPDRKQTASVEIEVEYSAYEASIMGGSREVSVSEALELQVAVNDPNDLDNVNPVRYAWEVSADYGDFKKTAAFYNDDALSSGKLSLAAGDLPAGTYEFTVTASKEPLTAKRKAVDATVTVVVKEQAVLKVSITDSLTSKVFKPSKSLSLRCEVPAEVTAVTYAWTMTSSVGDSDLAAKAMGTDLPVLTIPGGNLLPGVDYTFTCAATSDISGSSSKTISTESVPSSGKVLLSYLINGKYFADATCKIASGLGDLNLVAKDWVSDSDNLYYEFHAIETTSNDDILLGTPSAENSIISSLPEGTYDIKVYIRNDLEPASAKDAVSGAVYTLSENVKVCDLNVATDAPANRRRLFQAPANEMEQLYYRFQVGVAEGDVPKALSFGRIFGDAYGGADRNQGCTGDAAVATIKNNMLSSLVGMDFSVVPTNEYIGLQACAFDGLLYVAGEQDKSNVESVHAIFSRVLADVASPSNALDIAPSAGDPYACFYKSLDSIYNFIKADCGGLTLAETMLSPVSNTVTSLSQSMSTNTNFGSTKNVITNNFDIHASGDSNLATLSGKYTITVNTTGVSSPFAAYIDMEELLNDPLVLSEIISLGADHDSTATFAVSTASLNAVPAGYEPAAKFWDGTYVNGVAQFTEIPSLPEGVDAVQGVYGFDLPLTGGTNVFVVLYAIEIKLGLSSLEFFAPEYSYTTATGKLTNSIQLTPPFSMKNFEYTVQVTNLQPIAEFAAQVAVEGISLSVSKDGSEYVNVTTSALAGQTPSQFVAGDIDVHEVDDCMPAGLTSATTSSCVLKNNTYEFKLQKGADTKSYYVSIFRTPSTQGSLSDLKLAAASVYEQLYDVGDNKVNYNQLMSSYRAYVYSSVTSATVETKAQANAPAPFGPGGAHISVAGPGAFGLNSIVDFGNNSAEVGSSQLDSAHKHILIGQNPVDVVVTSQDGSSNEQYQVNIFRMGKPVSITERFAGLNADDFINSQAAQNVFINAKAAQLGLEPYQIEILLVSSGSVIIEYVIYPVVGTIRDPSATDAERQAIDEQVTKDNIVAADAIATNVLSKAGETLDFGQFGAATSEIQKSATPPIPRPDDLPCPVCPTGFITTTETNSEGLSYCSCKLPAKASSDDLSDGEIAGIAIGCLVFVAAVGVFSIVIYRRRRQAQQVLSGDSSDEEEEEETGNETEAEEADA